MAGPGRRDLSIYRGDTFVHRVQFNDIAGVGVDVSTFAWLAQLRGRDVSMTFTIDSTGAGAGLILLTLSAAQTAGLRPGGYSWDLQRTIGTAIETMLYGVAVVSGDVSRGD